MPKRHSGAVTIKQGEMERVRRIALKSDWRTPPPYEHLGNYNELLRQLANGHALFVPLPDPTQRAMLARHIENALQLGRDSATTAALQSILNALILADELAAESDDGPTP